MFVKVAFCHQRDIHSYFEREHINETQVVELIKKKNKMFKSINAVFLKIIFSMYSFNDL